MIKIIIDNNEIKTAEGNSLLQACLDNGIYIPNLCHLNGEDSSSASCRLCFVEIKGQDRPVTSCTVRAEAGMVISTDTPAVRQLQNSAFRLLLSTHRVDCGNCPANKRCELQKIARFLKTDLKVKSLETILKDQEIDETHPILNYYPNRCVLCGRCVMACNRQNDGPVFNFARRGIDTVISLHRGFDSQECARDKCLACVDVCPVSAITLRLET